jgi:transcription elongation factor GreA-like protein
VRKLCFRFLRWSESWAFTAKAELWHSEETANYADVWYKVKEYATPHCFYYGWEWPLGDFTGDAEKSGA